MQGWCGARVVSRECEFVDELDAVFQASQTTVHTSLCHMVRQMLCTAVPDGQTDALHCCGIKSSLKDFKAASGCTSELCKFLGTDIEHMRLETCFISLAQSLICG